MTASKTRIHHCHKITGTHSSSSVSSGRGPPWISQSSFRFFLRSSCALILQSNEQHGEDAVSVEYTDCESTSSSFFEVQGTQCPPRPILQESRQWSQPGCRCAICQLVYWLRSWRASRPQRRRRPLMSYPCGSCDLRPRSTPPNLDHEFQ